MFVIKFEGKIENVRGNAKNIFNFTQEFNEKSENLQTEGRHFRSMICKINDV